MRHMRNIVVGVGVSVGREDCVEIYAGLFIFSKYIVLSPRQLSFDTRRERERDAIDASFQPQHFNLIEHVKHSHTHDAI
jgi:hypothetical protein